MIVERMRAPEAGWAAPPSLAPAFRGGAGRLDSRRSGQTAGFHALARRGSARGLLFWGGAGAPAACGANGLEWTTSNRRAATARRPSAYATAPGWMPLGPGQRRGGSCRVRPGFPSSRGPWPWCCPHASNACRTAHVRGTTVSSPRRCSRHTPSVRLPEAFCRPPGRVPRRGRVPPPPRGPRPRGHAQGAEDSRSRGAQPRCACVAPLAPKVREPWACCDAWQSLGGNPSPQFPRAVILTEVTGAL